MNFIPKRPEADILAEWQRAIIHLNKPENYLARAYRYHFGHAADPQLPGGAENPAERGQQ